jgi:hypothetical protein
MNEKLERISKEPVVTWFRFYPGIFLDGLRIAGVPWRDSNPTMNLYLYTSPFGGIRQSGKLQTLRETARIFRRADEVPEYK